MLQCQILRASAHERLEPQRFSFYRCNETFCFNWKQALGRLFHRSVFPNATCFIFCAVPWPHRDWRLHWNTKKHTCLRARAEKQPHGPSQSSLRERCPIPRALPHSSFEVPGIRTSSQVPQRGPYGDARPQGLFYIIFRVLSKGAPILQVPLTERPQRGMLRFQSPSNISQRVPGKRTSPPMRQNGASMESCVRLQSLLLHISPRYTSPLPGSPIERHFCPLSPPPHVPSCNIKL